MCRLCIACLVSYSGIPNQQINYCLFSFYMEMFLLVGGFQVLIIPFRNLYAAINIYWLFPNLPLLHFLGIATQQQQQFPSHRTLLGMRRHSTGSESPGLCFRRTARFGRAADLVCHAVVPRWRCVSKN